MILLKDLKARCQKGQHTLSPEYRWHVEDVLVDYEKGFWKDKVKVEPLFEGRRCCLGCGAWFVMEEPRIDYKRTNEIYGKNYGKNYGKK